MVFLGLALAHPLPLFVYDDGGITLRYADRWARGLGLNYNDGERVNGCSNPLFALVTGSLLACGVTPSSAIQWLGSIALGATAGVLGFTLARFYSLLAACVGVGLLAGNVFLFGSMFNGLETPFTVLLGALLFFAAHLEREELAGAILGALVANKVSGGAAAVAYAMAFFFVLRRFPLRATAAALASFLPMLLFLLWSFGSPIPNSMLVKLDSETRGGFTPTWVLGILRWSAFWPSILSLASVLALVRWRDARRLPVLALGLWALLEVAAYSLIDLGDRYPWYVAPVLLPLMVLAAIGVDSLAAGFARAGAGWMHRVRAEHADASTSHHARRIRRAVDLAGAALAVLLCATTLLPSATSHVSLAGSLRLPSPARAAEGEAGVPGPLLPGYTRTDLARLAAGAWLGRHARAGEVLQTAYGLPAFAFGGPVFDVTGLNSAPDSPLRERADYIVTEEPARPPGDWQLAAVFDFTEPGDERDAVPSRRAIPFFVFARGGCHILREGLGHGVPGRTTAPLLADDLPVASRAWRAYVRQAEARAPLAR